MIARSTLLTFAVSAALLFSALPSAALAQDDLKCEAAASKGLSTCVDKLTKLFSKCVEADGAVCAIDDPKVQSLFSKTADKVSGKCSSLNSAVGYGPFISTSAMGTRVVEHCRMHARSLAVRVIGGTQASTWAEALADPTPQETTGETLEKCLTQTWKASAKYMKSAFKGDAKCVLSTRKGKTCDTEKNDGKIAKAAGKLTAAIDENCDNTVATFSLSTAELVGAADEQLDCLLAAAHPDPTPLSLACGPRAGLTIPAPNVPTQIVLDSETWGTKCGDGSDYAFWIRLAPQGSPVNNVLVHAQGGGACFGINGDCNGVSADLFESLSENMPTSGFNNTSDPNNPFKDFTMIFLPYCTQDVHFGGGATNVLGELTVHRFGGVNYRTSMKYLRDVLWTVMDGATENGYTPAAPRTILSGISAGGFATNFNYHWVLDGLGWSRTTAAPDSSLGLDNGEVIGVGNLGLILTPNAGIGWNAQRFLPSYCRVGGCAVGPVLMEALAPRLLREPEQVFANINNQVDNTQRGTTFFGADPAWTDAARDAYCATQGLNGIRWFFSAQTSSIHGILSNPSHYPTSLMADGTSIGEFMTQLLDAPETVVDAVEEGSLVGDIGAAPFDCSID